VVTEASTVETASAAAAEPLPSKKTANYSLFVMTIVVMFTVLDRQILALMIEPVKKDFGISDTQAALLLGAAFSLTYALAGLPIARLADRSNRRNIVAASIAFWSAATMACGITQNYVQLLIARMCIGIGESGYGPASWSIITDNFPREKVAFAVGTMNIGAQVGTGLALFAGGGALALVSHLPTIALPFGGVMHNWQWAFIIVGLPGLLWTLVVLTVKEPARRGVSQNKKIVPIKEVAHWVWKDGRAYLASIGGVAMKYLLSLGPTVWLPTMIHRKFDWELSTVGLTVGAITMVVAPIGLITGGKLSEYWARKGRADANMRIVLYGLLISVPLSIITPLLPNVWMVLGCYAVSFFLASTGQGPAIATFQLITPNTMRAQVSSITQFCSNVLAYLLGPLIIALFTDYIFGSPNQLHLSMALSTAVLGPLAILCVWQGMKPYQRAYERALRNFQD
jgi:MFS family permease